MRIGILETGGPPAELIGEFGSYVDMTENWLRPVSDDFVRFDVQKGEMPASTAEADLWAITGSRCAVYEAHDWIPPLEQFVREVRAGGRKMFGICFGHQIMAKVFGGMVAKSEKGWGLGVHTYETVNWPEVFGPELPHLAMQAFHQDQVINKPDDAVQISRSEFCEYPVLYYPGFGLSVQGHPEFSASYARTLLNMRSGVTLPVDVAEKGLETIDEPTTNAELARIVAVGWQQF